ncbi:MAG: hypothetical protein K0U98_09945 [Deltaproteobacteria bacterium]|nr:hypothetical protein [Deltaproteobacteria bacterium]
MIRAHGRPHAQRGSAYIVVLLVLLLLTIFGLSLVLITQTEAEIGNSTRDISRTFYASDSGVAAAVSFMLTSNNYDAHEFRLTERAVGALSVRDEVATTRVRPVGSRFSNLGDIASNAVFPPYERINHQFRSTSTRMAGTRQVAQKRIELMVEVDPWQPTAEALYDGPLQYDPPPAPLSGP